MCRNAASPSLFTEGRVAEIGIWGGVTLNTDDIASLSSGVSPPFVRPDNLLCYVPLGYGNPDPSYFGTFTPTVLTGTTVTDEISSFWVGHPPGYGSG
jgi:hypothetical protein